MEQRLATLERQVRQLEQELSRQRDKAEVEDVLTRYSRALDWLDAEMLEAVFWDDAEIDYGFFRGSGRDFKPLLMDLERSMGRRWHFTGQAKVAIDGDTAEAESYSFAVASEQASPTPPATIMHFYGFYIDRLLRRDGRWGIIRRRHLQVSGAFLTEADMQGQFSRLNQIGRADPAHPEYRRLAGAGA